MNQMGKPVAVMAGTPVDTRMGADVLNAHHITPLMVPVSADAMDQAVFQVQSPEEKHGTVRRLLLEAMAQGCEKAFIYFNSLSGAVSFPALSEDLGLRIVTPMDVYGPLAKKHNKIAVISANAQALAAQESVMFNANPRIMILSADMLSVVLDIEEELPAEEIIQRNHLDILMRYFEQNGCEALLLGCTHFPYIEEALAACTEIPIINPAEEMVRFLCREE